MSKRTIELVQINPGLNIIGQPHVITAHKNVADVITFQGIGGQQGKYVFALLAGFGTVPTGMTFTDNGDGTASISGTPSAYGDFPITLTLENNGRAIKKSYIIRAPALTLNLVQTQPIYAGVSYPAGTVKLVAQGGSGSGYVYSLATYFTVLDSSTGYITIGALSPGTYTDTASVTDSASNTISVPVALIVLNPVVAGNVTPNDSEIGLTGYSYQFTVTGATGAVTWSHTGSLPGGFTLSSAGVLSGAYTGSTLDPTATYPLSVTAADAGTGYSLTFSCNFTLYEMLQPIGSLSISVPATTWIEIDPSTFVEGGKAPITPKPTFLPDWMSWDTATQKAAGAPPESDAGTSTSASFSYVDALGATATAGITINIIEQPNPSIKVQKSGVQVGGAGPSVINFVGPDVTDDGLGGRVVTFGTAATLDVDTDGTLAADSDSLIATQKATKTYVDNAVAGSGVGTSASDVMRLAYQHVDDFGDGLRMVEQPIQQVTQVLQTQLVTNGADGRDGNDGMDSPVATVPPEALGSLWASFSNGGIAIVAGATTDDYVVPNFNGIITGYTIGNVNNATDAGTITIDLQHAAASTSPTFASMTASATPALSTTTDLTKSSTTLTGWTLNIIKGDFYKFVVTACTACTRGRIDIAVKKI